MIYSINIKTKMSDDNSQVTQADMFIFDDQNVQVFEHKGLYPAGQVSFLQKDTLLRTDLTDQERGMAQLKINQLIEFIKSNQNNYWGSEKLDDAMVPSTTKASVTPKGPLPTSKGIIQTIKNIFG